MSRSWKLWLSISRKRWQIGQVLLLSIYKKSPIGFRLVHLNFTLSRSKCQGQGHSQFDCEQKSINLSHAAFCRIMSASTLPFVISLVKWNWDKQQRDLANNGWTIYLLDSARPPSRSTVTPVTVLFDSDVIEYLPDGAADLRATISKLNGTQFTSEIQYILRLISK